MLLGIKTTPAEYIATGAQAAVTSPAEFAALVRQEWETYGELVRKLQLKPE